MDVGRRHNADPRWLLPLICRRGHITENEIGAIRIAANESYFEVTERAAPGFMKALSRATIAPEDDGMVIERAEPRGEAAQPTRGAPKGPPRAKRERAAKGGRKPAR